MTRNLLLVGTSKGAFILDGDASRTSWSVRGPLCEGWPIHDLSVDPASGAILAAGGSAWYGPAVFRSEDLGSTWTHSSEGLTYGDDGPKIPTIWNVTAAHGSIWAGAEPAGLFRSDDGGKTWTHVAGLRDHPSRPGWAPGAGGLICHTIVPHPTDAARMWVAISAVGTFATEDGGATWEARNRGVAACFQPDPHPETGQCVHKLVMAAGEPDTLYQQNHCGVYRSADAGRSWEDISAGLPSEFGFVMGAHPRDAATGWVIPVDPSRGGPAGARRRARRVADARSRRHLGAPGRGPPAGERVRGRPPRGDRGRSTATRPASTSGRARASSTARSTRGSAGRSIADHLPPIWGVEAVVLD